MYFKLYSTFRIPMCLRSDDDDDDESKELIGSCEPPNVGDGNYIMWKNRKYLQSLSHCSNFSFMSVMPSSTLIEINKMLWYCVAGHSFTFKETRARKIAL